ncbi:MAG: hypothetical protein NW215_00325 [Hyphomicrobiales bacterium]|nr:hypothetical protein [Hyphomicrobiales bacterium]
MIRSLVTALGLPVVLGLTAVSILLNYRFGLMLAEDDADKLIYGLASACADTLKALLPFILAWAIAIRRWLVTVAALILLTLFTAYSFTSSIGFAAINREVKGGIREAGIEQRDGLRRELERKETARAGMGPPRPLPALDARLEAERQHMRWMTSKGCTEATLPESRAFCDGYFRLKAERANAEAAHILDAEIQHLRLALANAGPQTSESRDPQVELFASLLALPEDHTKLALALLIALLIELGSGLGLFVVMSVWEERPKAPAFSVAKTPSKNADDPMSAMEPTTMRAALALPTVQTVALPDEDVWLRVRIEKSPNARTKLTVLYADYAVALEAAGVKHLSKSAFKGWLARRGYAMTPGANGALWVEGIAFRAGDATEGGAPL